MDLGILEKDFFRWSQILSNTTRHQIFEENDLPEFINIHRYDSSM